MFQRKKKSGVNFELGGISWILRSVSMVAKLESNSWESFVYHFLKALNILLSDKKSNNLITIDESILCDIISSFMDFISTEFEWLNLVN